MRRRGSRKISGTEINVYINKNTTNYNSKESLASALTTTSYPVSASNISIFNLIGNNIEARIEVEYILKEFFLQTDSVTSFIDLEKCVGTSATFFGGDLLQVIELWQATSHGQPSINYTYKGGVIQKVYMPEVLTWGANAGNNNIFWVNHNYSILEITAKTSMQTVNAGSEEGDIAHARTKGATIIYV